jgi:hypothetical protein
MSAKANKKHFSIGLFSDSDSNNEKNNNISNKNKILQQQKDNEEKKPITRPIIIKHSVSHRQKSSRVI